MALSNRNFANYGAISQDPEVVVQPSSSADITTLSESISANIENLNTYIRFFGVSLEQIGTQRDSNGLRDKIYVKIMNSNQLVKTLQKDISKLTNLSRGASKQQKLQTQRLTEHVKDVIKRNCEIQQVVVDKLKNNMLLSTDKMMESSGDNTSLLESEQIQIQKNLEFEKELLLERQQRIKQIENQILDVNQIMGMLSAEIYNQGSMVDTIEQQIENVSENVHQAHQELTVAANYAAKARKRKIIFLILVVIVLAILIAVIIWSSTS